MRGRNKFKNPGSAARIVAPANRGDIEQALPVDYSNGGSAPKPPEFYALGAMMSCTRQRPKLYIGNISFSNLAFHLDFESKNHWESPGLFSREIRDWRDPVLQHS
jgi:hypothetical protein